MNKSDERNTQMTEGNYDRRNFLKRIYKYAIGLSTFTIASVFGFRRSGDVRLGKMKDIKFGFSEAHGTCGFSADCSGGGGECGFSANCAGGGGECGFSANCAGGGGKCGFSANCAGE